MKKALLFTASALLLAGNIQAQSIRFVDNGKIVENNANITLYDFDETLSHMQWTPLLRNTTQNDIDVLVRTEVLSNPGNDFLSLCVGTLCYSPTVTETEVLTIPAGGDNTSFHTQYIPLQQTQSATATYTLVNVADEMDSQTVTVTYDYPAYLASEAKTSFSSQINLIQRGDNLVCLYKFDSSASRSIVISNIVGAKVATFTLSNTSGEMTLDKKLSKGIYVYTLVENGRNIKSHKIIIR